MGQNIEIGKSWLASTLNRAAENGIREIKRKWIKDHLDYCYRSVTTNNVTKATLEWKDIISCLHNWDNMGWIKIISNPQTADDEAVCVVMIKYLDGGPWIGGSELP
jgi:hypothetical protein